MEAEAPQKTIVKMDTSATDEGKTRAGYVILSSNNALRQFRANFRDRWLFSTASGKNQDLTRAPMYLVRSGNIYPPYQSLRDAGHGSYLWASTTGTDSTFAYYLLFSNTTILPAYHSVRINGMPVRWIAVWVKKFSNLHSKYEFES